MSTKQIHPHIRYCQQQRKKMLRECTKRPKGHTRKWWKAWHKRWYAEHRKEQKNE